MNRLSRITSLAAMILVASAVLSHSAQATLIMNIEQVGPNVVATGSGTINLTGLTLDFSLATEDGLLRPALAAVEAGATEAG